MIRGIFFLTCLWSTGFLVTKPLAQAISPDVQPAPLVRLTGVLAALDTPPPAGGATLRVWFGEKVWQFQVTMVEPVMPAYRARERLRDVSPQGLRLQVTGEALAQLEQAAAHQRPITIEGWLRPQAGVLRVSAVHMAKEG